MRYFVAAAGVPVLRPGATNHGWRDVTDLAPAGTQHAVSFEVLDTTVCGRDVDVPLTRFFELDYDLLHPGERCHACEQARAIA